VNGGAVPDIPARRKVDPIVNRSQFFGLPYKHLWEQAREEHRL
jgi:hypothetical protein